MAQEKTEIDKELESGKYLFKYCKFDINALQIIINKTLYFSNPDKLNDPLDCNFEAEIIDSKNFSEKTICAIRHSGFPLNEEVKLLPTDHGSVMGDIKSQRNLLEGYFKFTQNLFLGICSFSAKVTNENLLWSHYGNEARGICLVFDKEKLIDSLSQKLGFSYRLIKGTLDYNGVKKLLIKINEAGDFEYTFDHLFSKTKHWSYEEEYRIVIEKYEVSPFDFGRDSFYPFLKFDDGCLKYIIIGERILTEHFDMLDQMKKMKVFEAELLQHKFDR